MSPEEHVFGSKASSPNADDTKPTVTTSTAQLDWYTYLRYLVLRVLLWLTRAARVSRFAALLDSGSPDPFKYGAFSTPQVTEAEWPARSDTLPTKNDIVHAFCTSASGQIFALTLARRADKRATVFLYVRTQQASYVLPGQVHVDLSADDTFDVAGLRLECVIPMRRWRISFNGLLRNVTTQANEHVRFVFTANNVTNLADQAAFHSDPFLALQLAQNSQLSLRNVVFDPSSITHSLWEIDSILQTYSFVGKVRVQKDRLSESYEEEVYGFGHKKRCREKASSAVDSLGTLMGYTRNGISIYLEELSITGLSRSLTSGVFIFPSLEHCPVAGASLGVMKGNDLCRNFILKGGSLPAMEMNLGDELDSFTSVHEFNGAMRSRTVRIFRMTFDEREGHALFIGALGDCVEADLPHVAEHLQATPTHDKDVNAVAFDDVHRRCADPKLTGGKASSLAILTALSKQSRKFEVPRGLAVTTTAYALFAKHPDVESAVSRLEEALCSTTKTSDELRKICEQTVAIVAAVSLPAKVKTDLETELMKLFGDDFESYRFAVRSSSVAEDCEEMSAAGQMETVLGCRGVEHICSAVAKCWASQFSYAAVLYRRRHGQEINSRMAVCVQQMVASAVSGVMFTVDPLTCNPQYVTITANYGLGESVVSASADPDTFVLEKSGKSGARLVHTKIGRKEAQTVMTTSDTGGTHNIILKGEEAERMASKACLDELQLAKLGEAARLVEDYYASQRDTEWAFGPDGNLVMLQARPITSAHQLDTKFEFYHESDEGMVSEYDCLSKANAGEVFRGSVTPMTIELMFRCFIGVFREMVRHHLGKKVWEMIYARNQFVCIQNTQCFFSTFSVTTDYTKKDIISIGFAISFAGRIVDDEIVKIGADNKRRYIVNAYRPSLLALLKNLWQAEGGLAKAEKRVRTASLSVDHCSTAREMLFYIMGSPQVHEEAFLTHSNQIYYGTIFNVLTLAILSRAAGGWKTAVFSDFAKMVTSCKNIVSADVPVLLQELSRQAERDYGENLKQMSPEEALERLRNDNTPSAKLFAEFLAKHGHRCLREFDFGSRTWDMDPLPVIKTIQSLIGASVMKQRADVSIDDLLDSMDTKVGRMERFALRFLLHRVRKGIVQRERAKSNLIMSCHLYRLLFRQMADKLVAEGRLPDADLVFYLLPCEILQLIDTRSPRIVMRAVQRQRTARRAERDVYPEHVAGLPIRPTNASPDAELRSTAKGSRSITGTPASQGQVIAPCRVVYSLDDAHEIRPGDILVTYATDIGWSPYFPLLSGLVTELGGLISHGTVVARECGLPCLVAAHGAMTLFRSGEKILLDGTQGFARALDDDDDDNDNDVIDTPGPTDPAHQANGNAVGAATSAVVPGNQ